jgi:hypothetical protein
MSVGPGAASAATARAGSKRRRRRRWSGLARRRRPYELKFPLVGQDDSITDLAQVRCLVLYTHHGQEMAHFPQTRLTVRVVDRASGQVQLTNVRDHQGAFEEILRGL